MKKLILMGLALFISTCAPHPPTDIEKDQAQVYINQGVAWAEKGDFDNAIADFTKAIEINPNHAKAYNNRGLAYGGKQEYDSAISDFNKAIEINPAYAGAYNNRGIAHYAKGEHDKAWEDVRKAQSLGYQVDPEFLKALREASGLKDEKMGSEISVKKDLEKKKDPREACEEDCKKMSEKGELRQGITLEECIRILCK